MADFMSRFLMCSFSIGIMILCLFAVRRLLKKYLTARMRYNLWYVLLGLLAVPFLRLPAGVSVLRFLDLGSIAADRSGPAQAAGAHASGVSEWFSDISVSVSRKTPSAVWLLLAGLWAAGMCVMAISWLHAQLRLHQIRRFSLPVQDAAVRRIYDGCLAEMQIKRSIPIRSTAYINSPVITGFFWPCICLPSRLARVSSSRQIRYMLLHELQHYRYKDTLANHLMSFAGIIYWFHPLVRLALKEMRIDREIACDSSVLDMLCEEDYKDYGNTLLSLARQTSAAAIPFALGNGAGMARMKKRILHIAGYHTPSGKQAVRGILAFGLATGLLLGFAPLLFENAADTNRYVFTHPGQQVTEIDLQEEFDGYGGSFVLYDTADNSWRIYNKEHALTRTAPASTYKIYSALLGLETGTISREKSFLPWNGQEYPYSAWNADQDLISAMQHSVTWYFQAIDQQIGLARVKEYIRNIHYGNQNITGNAKTYWINGGLKISPVEQVELLRKLYDNDFGFSQEHIDLVKRSIRLETTEKGTLYGKTGTISTLGRDSCGWLIGCVETDSGNCFFAAHIQKEEQADGTKAAQIALQTLAKLGIWSTPSNYLTPV